MLEQKSNLEWAGFVGLFATKQANFVTISLTNEENLWTIDTVNLWLLQLLPDNVHQNFITQFPLTSF